MTVAKAEPVSQEKVALEGARKMSQFVPDGWVEGWAGEHRLVEVTNSAQ